MAEVVEHLPDKFKTLSSKINPGSVVGPRFDPKYHTKKLVYICCISFK
jgi:hypothetical protein